MIAFGPFELDEPRRVPQKGRATWFRHGIFLGFTLVAVPPARGSVASEATAGDLERQLHPHLPVMP
jgi:hypothetical protein